MSCFSSQEYLLQKTSHQLRGGGRLRPEAEGGVGQVEGAAQPGGGEVGVERGRRPAVGEAELAFTGRNIEVSVGDARIYTFILEI